MKKRSEGSRRVLSGDSDRVKWDYVRATARRLAKRILGVEYEHAEDCASDFTLAICEDPRLAAWPFSDLTDVWLKMEAAGHVHRYAERVRRRRKREFPAAELSAEAAEAVIYDTPSHQPGPEQLATLSDLGMQVVIAAGKLSAAQRKVWYAVQIEGKTIREIAEETGMKEHDISQFLYAAKKRLRQILTKMDLTLEGGVDALLNDLDRLGA